MTRKSGAGAVVGDAGEVALLCEHIAEFGCAVRSPLCRQGEALAKPQHLEDALVGPPDVAQRTDIALA